MGTTNVCCMPFEDVQETAPHKKAFIELTNSQRRTRHAELCWRSMTEFMGDVFPWTPTYRHTSEV